MFSNLFTSCRLFVVVSFGALKLPLMSELAWSGQSFLR
jgi:hypothetical protein